MNHPSVHLLEQDVRKVNIRKLREVHLSDSDLDLLVVCAPCQPFSRQNRNNLKDHRTQLLLSAVGFAKILRPHLIFFENVPGLTRKQFAILLQQLCKRLSACGYTLSTPIEVNAADYGVPQRRLRCVVLARRGDAPPALPPPTTPPGHRVTVKEAFAGLAKLASGEASHDDLLHFARVHRPVALERLKHIPHDGGSRKALPAHLGLVCHRDLRMYSDVYGRMAWSDVAPTLTTGCTDVTRGRFAHPTDDRAITLREAARLQTFPDHYSFWGNPSQMAGQIGNAVPVKLVEALAPTFRATVRS